MAFPVRPGLCAQLFRFEHALAQWAETRAKYRDLKHAALRDSGHTLQHWKMKMHDYEARFKEARAHWTGDFHHWDEAEWRKFITPDNLAELQHLQLVHELPEIRFSNHLKPPHIRLVQRITHALCLPVLDRLRPAWPETAYPQKISEEVVARLNRDLRMETL